LWWLQGSGLSEVAVEAVASPENAVFVSAATAWEVSIETALGKLTVDGDLIQGIDESGFEHLPITLRHAAAAGELPTYHRDPFDRMLVAQARAEGLTIVTRDQRLAAYGVPCLGA
jgi:PIN domain nuclease of toxin-antitoxin system